MKKRRAAGVERRSIIQVNGYISEKSINEYDEGSEKEQQQLANIISTFKKYKTTHGKRGLFRLVFKCCFALPDRKKTKLLFRNRLELQIAPASALF